MRTEREKRNFKKSIGFIACFLVLTAVLVLVSRMEARADGLMGVTNLRQTDSSASSVTFEWDADLSAKGYAYQLSNDGTAWSTERYVDSSKATIGNLNSGKSYYARVRSYDKAYWLGGKPADDAVFSDWSAPLEIVTCPETMDASRIKQTGATVSTIDIKWDPVQGTTIYSVYYYIGATEFKAGETVETSFTVTGLDPDTSYEIDVYPHRVSRDGYRTVGYCKTNGSDKYTATAKVKNLKLSRWETGGNRIYVDWDHSFRNITGYEVYVTNLSGKKVKRFKCTRAGEDFSVSSLKNKGFIFRVRTYKDVDGTTIYGAWSAKKVVIAQPRVQLKRKNSRTIQLTWSKVPGAVGYTVYRSTSPYSGYQKIKTTKATKLTNTGLSDTRDYYYYVVANKVKVGKKTYKTTAALEREIAYLNWQGSTEYDYMR